MLGGYSKLCHGHQLSVQLPSPATCILKARGRSQFTTVAAVKVPARLAQRHAVKQKQRAAESEAAAAAAHAVQKQRSDRKGKQKSGDLGAAQKKGKQKSQKTAQLSSRCAKAGGHEQQDVRWADSGARPSNSFLEFVPGRDTLYSPETLAAGLTAYDSSGAHILSVRPLPAGVLDKCKPLVLRGLQLFQTRQLPHVQDGRASGGPVDVARFLAQPVVQEQVQQALHKRAARLKAAGRPVPRKQAMLPHVVHVSLDQRKVYIGDEYDETRNGTKIMSFMKAWKSCPLHTWSGGKKMADMPGSQQPKLVASQLSTLLAAEEPAFVEAANALWDDFAAQPATASAAKRMQAHIQSSTVRAASAIGRTAFNAYAFNVTYRTGPHVDGKNVAGSYSCLMVFEVGDPVAGGFYMLPQFRAALDVRQGVVLYHRSGDAEVGLHGNSEMWQPNPQSHRIALVLYLTELKMDDDEERPTPEQPAASAVCTEAA